MQSLVVLGSTTQWAAVRTALIDIKTPPQMSYSAKVCRSLLAVQSKQ